MTTDLAAEAEGWLDGDKRHIAIQLGGATLELTYDSSTQQGAQAGGILIAMAPQLLAEVDEVFEDGGAEEDGLTTEDKDFLLAIVDNPHSDYDDQLEGYPNYNTLASDDRGNRILEITFESGGEEGDDDPRTNLKGQWALIYLGGEEETITNDLPEEAEGNQ